MGITSTTIGLLFQFPSDLQIGEVLQRLSPLMQPIGGDSRMGIEEGFPEAMAAD
jgi:hypothetical protein